MPEMDSNNGISLTKDNKLTTFESTEHKSHESPPVTNKNNVEATSKQYEEQQSYLQGVRLHLVTAACVN